MPAMTRRSGGALRSKRPARSPQVKKVSFAALAEKFRGMLKDGPRDLSTREGFGR